MASLDTRPDGYAEMRERIEKLERRQAEDERQFKAIAERLKKTILGMAAFGVIALSGLTGIAIAEEYKDRLIGLVFASIFGVVVAPIAKDPNEEPEPKTEGMER